MRFGNINISSKLKYLKINSNFILFLPFFLNNLIQILQLTQSQRHGTHFGNENSDGNDALR